MPSNSSKKNEDPWYLHAGLYLIIAILTVLLIKVAVLDPQEQIDKENYFKKETRLRMTNLKEAQILWQRKNGSFTSSLDGLINFIKNDKYVDSVRNSFDSLRQKPADPFKVLSNGAFIPDSLFLSPKVNQRFVMGIDSTVVSDTVINPQGKVLRVEKKIVKGTKYYIEDPAGYGSIGSIDNEALKNTASWE
ncbi:MAG: hypothetical protein B6D44_06370 [Ignavibacteriales bacterium UTCHB2]|jgi:hypothetical protein|nr:MAG: hypothetical protein BWY38_00942 [Ignavibacteria bacterium ADurb.Bin266]OQY73763.1 MAG: hypothetical protein B6D44_06370 [Ignavibacteriales bacterium UTCHB2]HQI40979.1 hypothetical protein [Ignavibacteriaceae bacterium]HQJ46476.1 hypothetical protein [Ignavibacteriaceae bacterium]